MENSLAASNTPPEPPRAENRRPNSVPAYPEDKSGVIGSIFIGLMLALVLGRSFLVYRVNGSSSYAAGVAMATPLMALAVGAIGGLLGRSWRSFLATSGAAGLVWILVEALPSAGAT